MGRYHYVFPKWSNMLLPMALLIGPLVPLYVVFVVAFGFSPKTTDAGYRPEQPVPYSHELHVGQLGIDCRYCHNTVEYADKAAIPPTQTCMNCHTQIHKDSPLLAPVLKSYQTGEPVLWKRVHDLPDFAYFSHSAHVTRGVSCVECHGRVDRMVEVYQQEPLSMSWCLECHRDPAPSVRDPDLVTQLNWGFNLTADQQRELAQLYGLDFTGRDDTSLTARETQSLTEHDRAVIGSFWLRQNALNPSQDCSACHR